MNLTYDLLLTLLIELPIVAMFFKRKKIVPAITCGLLVNVLSWPIVHLLKIFTDFDINYIEVGVIIGEGIGLCILTSCGWKKGFLISSIANIASFFIIGFIHLETDIIQNKHHLLIP